MSTSPATATEPLPLLRSILAAEGVREPQPGDAVDGVIPAAVVEPATVQEAAAVLRACSSRGLTVVVRGGGSKIGWGSRPERLDVILSTRRLAAVLEHAAGDLIARVQAGCGLADLQDQLRPAGQLLALDPPEPSATVGGVIAAAASGPRRLRYGTPRDLVIGITVVLSDGTVARAGGKVVKNVAGYDLGKLYAGSLGTLGLIAEVTVRLHPRPAAARSVDVEVADPDAALAAVRLMTSPGLVPSLVELDWRDRDEPGVVTAVYEGVDPGVRAQADRAMSLLGHPSSHGIAEPLLSRPPLDDRHMAGADAVRLQLNHPPAELPAALRACWSAGSSAGAVVALRAHAATGVTFVETDATDPVMVVGLVAGVRSFAAAAGGSVIVRAAPPETKQALDVWGPPGDAVDLMRRVKERFDPSRTMSPGRFVGGI